jgi:hypothetical protein
VKRVNLNWSQLRSYYAIESDDEEMEEGLTTNTDHLPKARFVKGRFISPWKTQKTTLDITQLLFSNALHHLFSPVETYPLLSEIPDKNQVNSPHIDHLTWVSTLFIL